MSQSRRVLPAVVACMCLLTGSVCRAEAPDAHEESPAAIPALLVIQSDGAPSDAAPSDAAPSDARVAGPQQAADQSEETEPADGAVAGAEEESTATTEPVVLVEGLTNPCGLAIQPETGHVFVSDSGAGRVVRIVDGAVQEVIIGFRTEVFGSGPTYEMGPLGLAFLDKQLLAVGGGGMPAGEDRVRIYRIPEPGVAPVPADAMQTQLGPLAEGENASAEGDFYAVAVTEDALFATSHGDDTRGWIARAKRGDAWGRLTRFIPTQQRVQRKAPGALTISPRGEVVVGQMGELAEPADSLLSFYGPRAGRLLLNLETQLHDVTALAYSPKTGLLYALDFAWSRPEAGGLYRLDDARVDGQRACKATLIHALTRPTAMAFSPDGELFVSVIGESTGPAEAKGAILRIASGL